MAGWKGVGPALGAARATANVRTAAFRPASAAEGRSRFPVGRARSGSVWPRRSPRSSIRATAVIADALSGITRWLVSFLLRRT